MDNDTELVIDTFKGIAPAVSLYSVDNSIFRTMENFYVGASPSHLKVREGFWQFATHSAGTQTAHIWFDIFTNSALESYLVSCLFGGQIRVTPNYLNATGSEVAGPANIRHGFQYKDLYYLAADAGLHSFAVAAVTVPVLVYSTQRPKHCTVFKDRLFCTVDAFPMRMYYSDIASIASIGASNYFEVAPEDGHPITGMTAISGDRLLVFKRDSIYVVNLTGNDPDLWEIIKVDDGVGAKDFFSIVTHDNWTYFIGSKGVYRTDGSTVQLLSDPVSTLFSNRSNLFDTQVAASPPTSVDRKYTDFAGMWNQHYMFTLPEKTDTIYLYNIQHNIWYTWIHALIARVGFFTPDQEMNTLVGATGVTDPHPIGIKFVTLLEAETNILSYNQHGSTSVNVTATNISVPITYRDGIKYGTANKSTGTTYTATLETRPFDGGSMIRFKKWRTCFLSVRGYASYALSLTDHNYSYTSVGTRVITDDFILKTLRYKVSRVNKVLAFKLVITPTDPWGSGNSGLAASSISVFSLNIFYRVLTKVSKIGTSA